MEKHIFDTDNLNDNNYYCFDEGNPTYVIIYPIFKFDSDMITEYQLNYMRKFQNVNKIILLNEEKMYNFITKNLASKIIQKLEANEEIRFAFSKQEEKDVAEAFARFKE